jgi:hypothetical protein
VAAMTAFVTIACCLALPAEAIEYGGFGGRPAYPREDNPRTESIFVHTLEPGQVQEEGIKVINNKSETKTLLVYAVDSVRSTDGAFACGQQTDPKSGVGSWIELEESEVTLESKTNKLVPFTISVPQNASAGEHNGCIIVQEKKEDSGVESGMSLSFRTGIRVAITIPGELTRKIEIVDFVISKQEDGDFLLHPAVRNTGNVSVDANVKVATRYFFGLPFAEHGGRYPILRGDTSEWNFELKRPFWGGWYRSSVWAEYDEHAEAGVGVESGEGLTHLKGPSRWFFSFPKWPALLIELAVLAAILFLIRTFLRRRKVRASIRKDWVPYAVLPGESVNAIAERCGVSWKLLAKANKLRPPYALAPGREIKVPPAGGKTGKTKKLIHGPEERQQ